MYVAIKRVCELKAPLDLCAENANDWSHFAHVHRKSHVGFQLIQKSENKEVFLYKARLLYPLPFFITYLAIREYLPEQIGYRQVYINLKNGQKSYLSSSVVQNKETVSIIGDYRFYVSGIWKLCPRLLFWIFRMRMKKVMDEDNEVIREQIALGDFKGVANCQGMAATTQDVFAKHFQKTMPDAELKFEDYAYADLTKPL
jgi:hypothetical protein